MIRLEIRVNCEWVTLMTPSGTINLVTLATRVPKIMKMMTNEKDDGNSDAEIKSQLRNSPPPFTALPTMKIKAKIT